jgi:hypothetical protein
MGEIADGRTKPNNNIRHTKERNAGADGPKERRNLPMTEGDAAFGQIIRRQFHRHLIPSQNPDAITAETAGEMSQNDAIVLELNAKQTAREFLENGSSYFDTVFFAQCCSLLSILSDSSTGRATGPAG